MKLNANRINYFAMRRIILFLAALALCSLAKADGNTMRFRIIETTDIHGSFFPYDFINRRPVEGSLARAYTYISDAREEFGDRLLLVDNGDILQGQPVVYFYNYVASDEENITASITNFMGYDAQVFGNHDIETGHAVYDKWAAETIAPLLGANIISEATGEPYTKPYAIFEREGIRIAVIGMLTNAVPCWLGEDKWSGLHFDDITASAKKWAAYVKETEHADIVIGLFHSGLRGGIQTGDYSENASERTARTVDGFDAILFGHDHTVFCDTITNDFGHTVWMLNPANAVKNIAELDIDITLDGGAIVDKKLAGRIIDVRDMPVSDEFGKRFADAEQRVKEFTTREIGSLDRTLYSRDAFFGSCPYVDFINAVQLDVTGADISFSAPLQTDAVIHAGTLCGADMFNLYKYENQLSVVRLTGQEIKDYLEMSYALWTNTMADKNDHIMLVSEGEGRPFFVNPTFNFDSALGIDYEVDVTKPAGEKVKILQMTSGEPFSLDAEYKVALNSYRATGGGELLTKGAKIRKEDIPDRIVWQGDKDIRSYIMQYIEREKAISPRAAGNWRFVPDDLAAPALERDKQLIFGE